MARAVPYLRIRDALGFMFSGAAFALAVAADSLGRGLVLASTGLLFAVAAAQMLGWLSKTEADT